MDVNKIPVVPQGDDWIVFNGSCERTFKANGREFLIRINGLTNVDEANDALQFHAGSTEKAVAIAYMLGVSDPKIKADPLDFYANKSLKSRGNYITRIDDEPAIVDWRKNEIRGVERRQENLDTAQKIYNFCHSECGKGKEKENDPGISSREFFESKTSQKQFDSTSRGEPSQQLNENWKEELKETKERVEALEKEISKLRDQTKQENKKSFQLSTSSQQGVNSSTDQKRFGAYSVQVIGIGFQPQEERKDQENKMASKSPQKEPADKPRCALLNSPRSSSSSKGFLNTQDKNLQGQLKKNIIELIEFFKDEIEGKNLKKEIKQKKLLDQVNKLIEILNLREWALKEDASNQDLIESYRSLILKEVVGVIEEKKQQQTKANEREKEAIGKELVALKNIRKLIQEIYTTEFCPNQDGLGAFGSLRSFRTASTSNLAQ